jgi:hypothetical protein
MVSCQVTGAHGFIKKIISGIYSIMKKRLSSKTIGIKLIKNKEKIRQR